MKDYVLKGNIYFSKNKDKVCTVEGGYVVCLDGICAGVYQELPQKYRQLTCIDYGDCMILPGMTDIHVHAPQYSFRGLGMDMELIDWLNTHTFPEESKYADLEYAKKAYEVFVQDLLQSATTRACIFGTLHKDATLLLMDMLEKAGLAAYVGKVNMDRNSPEYLCEKSVSQAVKDTKEWIENCGQRFEKVKPILTPRFIPTCSDELMSELSALQKKYDLPMQSHLSENLGEIQWVKELCPDTRFYGEAYDKHQMFGGECKTIMAHCVYSTKEEIALMEKQNVFVAHCPESNANLASGIAPMRTYFDLDMKAGLGTDVAAGSGLSLFKAMAMAIQCSKMRWRLVDQELAPLKMEEVFYLATKGGGEFFGKVGSFEEGYEFDAVIVDDSSLQHPQELDLMHRLERLIYLAEDRHVVGKYIAGEKVLDVYHK